MNYYDDYYEVDSADRLDATACYCTNHSICSYCAKGYN